MPISRVYRKAKENVINSFDFADIFSGKFYQILYAGAWRTASTNNPNVLRGFAFDSTDAGGNTGESTNFGNLETGGSYVKHATELDFDLEVGKNFTIEGEMLTNFSIGIPSSMNGKTFDFKFNISLRRWDGTTETEIAQADSAVIAGTAGASYEERRIAVLVEVTKTTFKKGEFIRVSMEVFSKSNTAGMGFNAGHDPNSVSTKSDVMEGDLSFKVWTPFDVQL